jgi:hypothetical protein
LLADGDGVGDTDADGDGVAPVAVGVADRLGVLDVLLDGPGTAVPRAVAGSRLDEELGWVFAPPPEKPQARMPNSPKPRARVITRRRQ